MLVQNGIPAGMSTFVQSKAPDLRVQGQYRYRLGFTVLARSYPNVLLASWPRAMMERCENQASGLDFYVDLVRRQIALSSRYGRMNLGSEAHLPLLMCDP